MKAVKWLDEHFEETILCVLLVCITCVSMLQICARTFATSLPWPEEFSRLCWIWTVFLSLPYTIRKGTMLRVSILMDMVPSKLRNALNILIDLVIALALGIFLLESFDVVANMFLKGRVSTALGWSMGMLYTVTLFGYGLGSLRAIQQAIIHAFNFNKRELTTLEATMQEAAEEAAMANAQEGGDAQ